MDDNVVALANRKEEPLGRERIDRNEIRGHHCHDMVIERHTDIRVDCHVDQAETVFLVLRDCDLVVVASSVGTLRFTVNEDVAGARGSTAMLKVLLSDSVYLPRSQALVDFAQEVWSKVVIIVRRCRPVENNGAYDAVSVLR